MNASIAITIYIIGTFLFIAMVIAGLRRKAWFQCRRCGGYVSDHGDMVFEKPIELIGEELPKTLCEDCWKSDQARKADALTPASTSN